MESEKSIWISLANDDFKSFRESISNLLYLTHRKTITFSVQCDELHPLKTDKVIFDNVYKTTQHLISYGFDINKAIENIDDEKIKNRLNELKEYNLTKVCR
jgi:hypothetical protein